MTTIMNTAELKTVIRQEANQCVKCGMCLPHCPTYTLTQNECESPRGRIALLEGLATEQLPQTAKMELYLDHCLTCRACEMVCPAGVKYGKLIDHGKTMLLETNPKRDRKIKLPRSLNLALKYPKWLNVFRAFLYLYQRCGLQNLLHKLKLLKLLKLQRLDELLPAVIKPISWQTFYGAQTQQQGTVALFLGCISNLVDQVTLVAAIKVLTYCGYNVYVPPAQRCCGAMHLHAGFSNQSNQFAAINQQVFSNLGVESIITVASGCAAVLKEYSLPIFDVSQFLLQISWPESMQLKPLLQSAVIHTPCTLRNVLQQTDAPFKLLQKIPNLKVTLLKNPSCCGAAGTYLLQYPHLSEQLLTNVLNELSDFQPDWLLTSNIGCHLHINKALREKGYKTRVVHPIVLLAQQLKFL